MESFPKSRISERAYAHNAFLSFFGLISQRISIQKDSIKGTSPRMSRFRWMGAGMTVEASVVLPLFLLFFLNIAGSMEMMRLHGNLETALWETGREMCLYGSFLKESSVAEKIMTDESIVTAIGNLAVSYSYVKAKVENYLGADYLEGAPIAGGKNGLQYAESRILGSDDLVELCVTYYCVPKWRVEGFQGFLMGNRYVGRMWTGYEIPDEETERYYLAENMSVFHRSPQCSHLYLKAEWIFWENLAEAVNDRGKHYRPCGKCCVSQDGLVQVWIAPEGECFHVKRDCPGLKRTVREVTWEEASRYRPCSRCGYVKGK